MVGFPQFTRSHYFGLKTIFAVEAFHGRLLDWEPQGNSTFTSPYFTAKMEEQQDPGNT